MPETKKIADAANSAIENLKEHTAKAEAEVRRLLGQLSKYEAIDTREPVFQRLLFRD